MLAIVVAAAAFAAAPAMAADTPIGLTATARSDHLVVLTWSWPANATYPDELDVLRDGMFASTVDPTATTFQDIVSQPGSTHTYELVPVTGGASGTPTPETGPVTLRADVPNKPTNVAASFAPNTNNIATVTWTRGSLDADVTYTVTAQQVGGGPINTRTIKYPDEGTVGSLTMDVFASYTTYVFKVSAVEQVGDPAGDPGGTAIADTSPTVRSFDVISPTFGGTLSAAPSSLGTVTATWPAATDAGSGVASYVVCVDITICSAEVLAQPLESSQSASVSGVRNDGNPHGVSVVAKDFNGNLSTPIAFTLSMPLPAKPSIALTSGGTGCQPLVAHATSSDTGPTLPTFHLFLDGSTNETALDAEIAGAPYQQVSLAAQATFGPDLSEMSTPQLARVYDPTGPDTAPEVHGRADQGAGSEILSWDAVHVTGAPISRYVVTISTLAGYQNGQDVAASEHMSKVISGNLEPTENYVAQVTAIDACDRPGPQFSIRFQLADVTAPSAPVLNVPTTDGRSIHLSWAPSTDNVSVDEYLVFQDGNPNPIGHTPYTYFDIMGLNDNFTASYYVVATDTVSNRSAPSMTRSATTKDTTPPSAPGPLVQKSSPDGTVTLGWLPATDNVGVVGYQVVRDGVAVQNVVSPAFTDKNLPAGSYRYEVRAYDAASLMSAARSLTVETKGTPKATAASTIKVVKSKGTMVLRVGGSSGSRIVLLFKIPQAFNSAVLRLNVLKSVPMTKRTGSAKARVVLKPKLRVSLPAGSGRTQAGKRLAERAAKKGTLTIPIGRQKEGTLRLIVTATGGVLTLAGSAGGTKAPTIVSAGS